MRSRSSRKSAAAAAAAAASSSRRRKCAACGAPIAVTRRSRRGRGRGSRRAIQSGG